MIFVKFGENNRICLFHCIIVYAIASYFQLFVKFIQITTSNQLFLAKFTELNNIFQLNKPFTKEYRNYAGRFIRLNIISDIYLFKIKIIFADWWRKGMKCCIVIDESLNDSLGPIRFKNVGQSTLMYYPTH